jgi:hypothetical protein
MKNLLLFLAGVLLSTLYFVYRSKKKKDKLDHTLLLIYCIIGEVKSYIPIQSTEYIKKWKRTHVLKRLTEAETKLSRTLHNKL